MNGTVFGALGPGAREFIRLCVNGNRSQAARTTTEMCALFLSVITLVRWGSSPELCLFGASSAVWDGPAQTPEVSESR